MLQKIKIDLNNPYFQQELFSLEKHELSSLIGTLKKISRLTWEELYKDHGLKWEKISSKKLSTGEQIYSFRFSKKYRITATRQDNFLKLLMLHTDHDSAYQSR